MWGGVRARAREACSTLVLLYTWFPLPFLSSCYLFDRDAHETELNIAKRSIMLSAKRESEYTRAGARDRHAWRKKEKYIVHFDGEDCID